MKIKEILEGMASEICTHYCKYPECYEKANEGMDDDAINEKLIEEKCNKCPLSEVI